MTRRVFGWAIVLCLLLLASIGQESTARAALKPPLPQGTPPQSIHATNVGGALPSANLPRPKQPYVILYDQYNNIASSGTNSQNYVTLPSYDDYLADDFVVGAGEIWSVNEVDLAGFITGPQGPISGFNVSVYQDAQPSRHCNLHGQ